MVTLTADAIDAAALLAAVQTPRAGAAVLFIGAVREQTGDRRTESLDYECYADMAAAKMRQLEDEARSRWPILDCQMVHRVGHLELGEISVAVAVSTPHRDQAFEAARWLIDTLKIVVPIWKKENWADGTSEWVHPGMES
jgi:molybdopterin synthase catalytic subunit